LPYLAVAGVAALAGGGGGAVAAPGDAVIQACAAKSDGALRIAATCKTTELPMSWNKQGSSPTRLWFAVNSNGKIVASSGLASRANARSGMGIYTIRFSRKVRGVCAPVVSLGTNNDIVAAPGEIATNFVFTPSSEMSVRTFDSSGTPTDQPFHGAVFC
jgi:hypothetical protein